MHVHKSTDEKTHLYVLKTHQFPHLFLTTFIYSYIHYIALCMLKLSGLFCYLFLVKSICYVMVRKFLPLDCIFFMVAFKMFSLTLVVFRIKFMCLGMDYFHQFCSGLIVKMKNTYVLLALENSQP